MIDRPHGLRLTLCGGLAAGTTPGSVPPARAGGLERFVRAAEDQKTAKT